MSLPAFFVAELIRYPLDRGRHVLERAKGSNLIVTQDQPGGSRHLNTHRRSGALGGELAEATGSEALVTHSTDRLALVGGRPHTSDRIRMGHRGFPAASTH